MDSNTASLLLRPSLELMNAKSGILFDSSHLRNQPSIPRQFIWPHTDRSSCMENINVLQAPIVDLNGFLHGDDASTELAAGHVRSACTDHGFFQITGHGVDSSLTHDALSCADEFFKLPLQRKLKARRKGRSMWGYAGAHTERFATKLPWKETLTFGYDCAASQCSSIVVDYFTSTLGNSYRTMGMLYQRYCEAMAKLSLSIMELLAISLGVDRSHYRDFFADGSSIIRCNYYPPCQEPELTFGTGPHCDPTSLTILLQQEDVQGLEVFSGGEWRVVPPVPGALVINIGDTFMALSNGKYKSCLHRAVVNRKQERRSLAFFLCPREDRVVSPPKCIVEEERQRKYPDFTWAELFQFTQTHYRADTRTLQSFSHWLRSSPDLLQLSTSSSLAD